MGSWSATLRSVTGSQDEPSATGTVSARSKTRPQMAILSGSGGVHFPMG